METTKFTYKEGLGWSIPTFPALDSDRSVLYIFGAPEVIQSSPALGQLLTAFPKSKIVGCSGAGEIYGSEVNDKSLSVAVAKFERTDIAIESMPIQTAADSFTVGAALAKKLDRPDLCGIFIISDGLLVNGSTLAQGFSSIVGKNVIITGGLAGDGSKFEKTWVIENRQSKTGVVTALGYYGKNLKIHHGSQGGWDIFGPERIVTKSKDNVLFELDGKPALALYKEYLGNRANELPAAGLLFPLQIRAHKTDKGLLVRTILGVNEKDQSLTFAGDIPKGWIAQLMRANFDRLIEGASHAAMATQENLNALNKKTLTLAVSCVGRRLVLGERIQEEVEATLEKLPKGTEQVGFYSYGEISPYIKGEGCQLHNQTMTLTTIYED